MILRQVPFEVLVRRQIARLLDPSLQCARFIYDELMKVAGFLHSVTMIFEIALFVYLDMS